MTPTPRWIRAALSASLDTPPLPWARGLRRRPAAFVAPTPAKPGRKPGKAQAAR